jgi:hypothetical protein
MAPNSGRKVVKTFRLEQSLIEWLASTAQRRGRTLTAVVEELLEDARKMYDLPRPVVEQLEADAALLGLDHRHYAQHVFFRRFEELRGGGSPRGAPGDERRPVQHELQVGRTSTATGALVLASGPNPVCKEVETRAVG